MSDAVADGPVQDLAPPAPLELPGSLIAAVDTMVAARSGELTTMRRWLHARPETSRNEHETTTAIAERLIVDGLEPRRLSCGTGLICDIGDDGPIVALRADIDALAMADAKSVPYRSMHANVCHACGHDVHTSVVTGAGLVLRDLAARGLVPGRVRLIYEPSEEAFPGGALDVISDGGLNDVTGVFGVHCDPKVDAEQLGLRIGAITSASDALDIDLIGPGGHTARPHLTVNLAEVTALLVLELPAAVQSAVANLGISRLVFGSIHTGSAPNVIPAHARISGSLRTPDQAVWDICSFVVPRTISEILGTDLRPTGEIGYEGSRHDGLQWRLHFRRGTPVVVNDAEAANLMGRAARAIGGEAAVVDSPHSWGADTFGWYLHAVPGCYARLGTHWPQRPVRLDLHRPEFDVDERAIPFGVKVLVLTALAWLQGQSAGS